MMAEEQFVIIGNGPAAHEAALTLREHSADCRITMISRERAPHYRPHLLPEFIVGMLREEDLYVIDLEYYKAQGIKLRLGQEVVAVDFIRRELTLDHKEVLPFTGLIIATGGRPHIPEPLQVFQDLMLTLKTVADAKLWIQRLANVKTVLIIGGDLTSLAFTRALLSLGKGVRFILDEDSFWPLRISSDLRDLVARKLAARGVEVVQCRRIRSLARLSDRSIEVETDGGRLEVGLVGAFFGLVPDVGFLVRSGLHIERGVLVDEFLKTRFDGVYAAGDCAQVYHPVLRDYWVSIGYGNARNLGRIAALNLTGGRVRADVAPESIFQVEGIVVNTSWWSEF